MAGQAARHAPAYRAYSAASSRAVRRRGSGSLAAATPATAICLAWLIWRCWNTPQLAAAGSVSSRPLSSGQLANSYATQSAKARTLGDSWRLCGYSTEIGVALGFHCGSTSISSPDCRYGSAM